MKPATALATRSPGNSAEGASTAPKAEIATLDRRRPGCTPETLRDTWINVPFQCGETSLLADGPESKGIFPLACNCWDCDECGPNRLAQLRALIMAGRPTVMLTLTERPSQKVTAAAQARRQTEAWKKLYARLLRKLGVKHVPFIWHREATKIGTSHLHVLMRIDAPPNKTWFKDNWKDLTGSFMVSLDPIYDREGISAYVTKHTAKAPAKFGDCKRYFATRDWSLAEPWAPEAFPDVGAPYELERERAVFIVHRFLSRGFRIVPRDWRGTLMRGGP